MDSCIADPRPILDLSIHLSIYPSVYLSLYLSIYPSIYLAPIFLPSAYLSVFRSVSLSKVYKEYVSIFRGGAGSDRRSSYRFDALVFDQVMRYRVSCRHWVCPACAARASDHTADTLRISV